MFYKIGKIVCAVAIAVALGFGLITTIAFAEEPMVESGINVQLYVNSEYGYINAGAQYSGLEKWQPFVLTISPSESLTYNGGALDACTYNYGIDGGMRQIVGNSVRFLGATIPGCDTNYAHATFIATTHAVTIEVRFEYAGQQWQQSFVVNPLVLVDDVFLMESGAPQKDFYFFANDHVPWPEEGQNWSTGIKPANVPFQYNSYTPGGLRVFAPPEGVFTFTYWVSIETQWEEATITLFVTNPPDEEDDDEMPPLFLELFLPALSRQ